MSLYSHFKQGPMFGCTDPQCCGVYPPEDTDHCPECLVEWPCDVELLRQRAERAEDKLARIAAAILPCRCSPSDYCGCVDPDELRAIIDGGAE